MTSIKNKIKIFFSLIIWFLSTLVYGHQYYLRVSVEGLSKQLALEFSLTEVQLANLEAYFFMPYIFFLPLAGIMLDRYGSKKILPLCALTLAIACFILANTNTHIGLITSRLLAGFAASFSLMGAYVLIKDYFAPNLFPVLSGLTLTTGL